MNYVPPVLVKAAFFALGGVLAYSCAIALIASTPIGWVRSALFVFLAVAIAAARLSSAFMRALRSAADRISTLPLVSIFILAFALRVGWLLLSQGPPVSDGVGYDDHAVDILNGLPLLKAQNPAGEPLFLVAHYAVFGHRYTFPRLTQCLLGAIEVLLIFSIAKQLGARDRVAKASALLWAVYPESVLWASMLWTESIFSFLAWLANWLWLMAETKGGRKKGWLILCSGLAFGMAHWVRPIVPFFAFPIAIYYVFTCRRQLRQTAAAVGMWLLGMALMIAPIVGLNYKYFGILSPNTHQNLRRLIAAGMNQKTKGMIQLKERSAFWRALKANPRREGETELEHINRVATKMAIESVTKDPLGFVWVVARYKFPTLWGRVVGAIGWSFRGLAADVRGLKTGIEAVTDVFWKLMLLACTLGLFCLARRGQGFGGESALAGRSRDLLTVIATQPLVATAVHMVLGVEPRYHNCFIPTICLFAAHGLVVFSGQFDAKAQSGQRIGAAEAE